MSKPYSMDLRERVALRVVAGESVRSVASTFMVSASSVVRWSQRRRTTGSVAPGKIGGHRKRKLAGERDWILQRMASTPEMTLRGLMAELAERGITVSYGAIWNFVHHEELSFKEKRSAGRAGAARRGTAKSAMEEVSGQD